MTFFAALAAALIAAVAPLAAVTTAPTTTHTAVTAPTTTHTAESWDVDTATDAPAPCTTYDVPETDEGYATAQELQAQGWYGDPTDHAERLYSPTCR